VIIWPTFCMMYYFRLPLSIAKTINFVSIVLVLNTNKILLDNIMFI